MAAAKAIKHGHLVQARRFNSFAKVVYMSVVVVFNAVFWIVAVYQYHRPAEEYLVREETQEDEKPAPPTAPPTYFCTGDEGECDVL